ncbi:DUF1569 domain-containing protein [Flavicella sp.]|uniref:DUF1569 domain-containing protein n=1 Tax=Flavicella sp. TaxID=2957742 RepID=UPI0030176B4A
MENLFDKKISEQVIDRIEKLKLDSSAVWGKMDVAQMLAHCCVTYEMVYDKTPPKPNKFQRLILSLLLKNIVVGEKPYKINMRTSPEFIITEVKDFDKEKSKLIKYINKTQLLGKEYFENKESPSFGALSSTEWNNLFSKHLDHHLHQFSV